LAAGRLKWAYLAAGTAIVFMVAEPRNQKVCRSAQQVISGEILKGA
jgi:hypothetical protein